MHTAVHLILWLFVGALIVLIVKNASSFAAAVTAVDTPVLQGAQLLSGGSPNIS
jgi:hypothetical protein